MLLISDAVAIEGFKTLGMITTAVCSLIGLIHRVKTRKSRKANT